MLGVQYALVSATRSYSMISDSTGFPCCLLSCLNLGVCVNAECAQVVEKCVAHIRQEPVLYFRPLPDMGIGARPQKCG